MRFSILVTLALLVAQPVFAAKVYKWVDESGKVHYSDAPRASSSNMVMETRANASQPDTTVNDVSNKELDEKHQSLCRQAAVNMKRFLPDIEAIARSAMENDPAASKQDFDKAMGELQELKKVPTSALTESCVADYENDPQARSFAACFGEANSAMEASMCMAFSG